MVEQRAVACFLWTEHVKGVEIHIHTPASYEDNVLHQCGVCMNKLKCLNTARQL